MHLKETLLYYFTSGKKISKLMPRLINVFAESQSHYKYGLLPQTWGKASLGTDQSLNY